MSVEIRKKSSSFTQSTNPNKTINKYQTKQGQLSTCRSVSAFADTLPNNTKNPQTNRSKQIEKFSIDNTRHYSAKRNCDQTKTHNKANSFVGYKEAIQKRKKKSASGKKNFSEELFITIDTFQQTLCSLPLDKLILSENPFYWVEEQAKTLQKLMQKFIRITYTLKEQTKQYYQSKLQSVSMVIKNIKQNLDTLNKMSLLKNYTSGGTSMQSRNSQSSSSLGQTSNFPFGFKANQSHQRSRYQTQHEDKINQGLNYATDYESSEGLSCRNQENKQNCIRFSNELVRKSQPANDFAGDKKAFGKVQIIEKDQFVLKDYKSSHSENQDIVANIKTLRSERSFSGEQNQRGCNQNVKTNLNQFLSKKTQNTIQSSHEQNASFFKKKNMNKTVSKYPKHADKQEIETRQNFTNFVTHQSKQTFNTLPNDNFQQSMDFGEQTKRRNITVKNSSSISLSEQINSLKKQLDIKNQIIVNQQNKQQKFIRILKEQFGKKEKHYLETIYELKTECKEQQESIKQLLFEREEGNDQFELLRKQLRQRIQLNNKLSQKLNLLQQSAQTLSNQLRQYKIRQQQLRETVQLQRQRTRKLQKQVQCVQSQLEQMNRKLQQFKDEKNVLMKEKDCLTKQLSLFNEEKLKMEQKEEIYKLKYFRLYAEFDKFKEKVNDNAEYWKKICLSCKRQHTNPQNADPQKSTQMRELINFHKKRLLQ